MGLRDEILKDEGRNLSSRLELLIFIIQMKKKVDWKFGIELD